jgi:phage repressor protein C with HTH and peptisase S24 domain
MKLPFSVFIVQENSMLPRYKSGDHVVTFNWGMVKAGDVIVFKVSRSHLAVEPAKRDLDQHYVKRVVKINRVKVSIAGDNVKESAKMPLVQVADVIGKVIWRY